MTRLKEAQHIMPNENDQDAIMPRSRDASEPTAKDNKETATMAIVEPGLPLMDHGCARLITKTEAIRMLGCCETTFQNRWAKLLTKTRIGKRVMFLEVEVIRLRESMENHKSAADAPPLTTAIPMHAYGAILDDLEAGLGIVPTARKHDIMLPEAEKLYRDYIRLKKSVILDDTFLTELYTFALKRYAWERPAIDSAADVVRLVKALLNDVDVEDDARACRSCPYIGKRRATLCDVCAQDRYDSRRSRKK